MSAPTFEKYLKSWTRSAKPQTRPGCRTFLVCPHLKVAAFSVSCCKAAPLFSGSPEFRQKGHWETTRLCILLHPIKRVVWLALPSTGTTHRKRVDTLVLYRSHQTQSPEWLGCMGRELNFLEFFRPRSRRLILSIKKNGKWRGGQHVALNHVQCRRHTCIIWKQTRKILVQPES